MRHASELGALSYDQTCTLDGKPSVALSIYQLPGSNALETAQLVRAKMEELQDRFPRGHRLRASSTTPRRSSTSRSTRCFKRCSTPSSWWPIVVLVFLQNWRSALIPLVAVPVAIIGTFAVMAAIGFSLNNLTLFGLVLAIGIVVDDAIVVVEAVEHHIEHGLPPREAAIKAMEQVSGPVIAVGLVLTAVFVPCAFITGIIGQFFRQFALTIAVSTVISAFNSLTLSPALAAILLKPRSQRPSVEALPRLGYRPGRRLGSAICLMKPRAAARWQPSDRSAAGTCRQQIQPMAILVGLRMLASPPGIVGWLSPRPAGSICWSGFFRLFNTGFDAFTDGYTRIGRRPACASASLVLLVYGGLLVPDLRAFTQTPTGFIPQQDKGYLLVNVQLPDAASLERTEAVDGADRKMRAWMPGVKHTVAIAGQSILLDANAPNFGAMYLMLDDFHRGRQRQSASLTGNCEAFDDPGRFSRKSSPIRDGSSGRLSEERTSAGEVVRVEARSTSSAPPWTAWARPAASRSSSRTAATCGLTDCRESADDVVEGRQCRPPAWKGCSPASAPTRPGWTWTSTAAGQDDGRVDRRRLQHAAGLPRLAIRQRFQPLRPHLAGQRPGRQRVPQAGGRPEAAQGEERQGRAWCRCMAFCPRARRERAGDGRSATTCTSAAAINGNPARAPAPARPSHLMDDVAKQEPAAVDADRVDRAGPAAAADRQHGHAGVSCWPWCWCSWCWPPSTKAGRCRWP